jgi:hypothetical protein
MTAAAKSLTTRATTPVASAPHVWSMPANDVRTFMDAFDRLGYAVDQLMAFAAIRRPDLDNPDARIPCEALGAIIECAQRERFTPNLGLELARVTTPSSSPLLDYLVLTSETVGAGMRQLAHYFHLVGNPVVFELQEGDEPIHVGMRAGAAPFSVEYVTALTILRLRAETDGRFAARDVSFRHTPDDAGGFERVLGCPIHSKAPSDGFRVSRDAWRLPLRRSDPVLRQMLETRRRKFSRGCRRERAWRWKCSARWQPASRVATRRFKPSPGSSRSPSARCSDGWPVRAFRTSRCSTMRVRRPLRDTSAVRRSRSARSRTWSATQSRRRFIAPSSAGTG